MTNGIAVSMRRSSLWRRAGQHFCPPRPPLSYYFATTIPYAMFSRHLAQKIPSTLLTRSTALGRTAYSRFPKFCRLNEPRLDVRRQLWSTPRRHGAHEQSTPYAPPRPASPASATPPQSNVAFETQEPRLSLTFTCTVTDCGTRSTHEFTKRSYQRGIVIVQCPGCENR